MSDTAAVIRSRLDPWARDLGRDRVAYTNHVLRVLALCDALHDVAGDGGEPPSAREEFRTAAVFHDLGIWTADTLDYLPPSVKLARKWLSEHGLAEREELVCRMIDLHHKIRAAGPAGDPVETFRRADTIDVTLGLRRFGVPWARYRQIARTYPDAGFHRRLAQLAGKQLRTDPRHPAPMFKW